MFVRAEIETESNFQRYGEAVELRLNKALVEAAEIMLKSVREHETRIGVPRGGDELPGVHVPAGVHLRDSFKWEIVKAPFYGFKGAISSGAIVVYSLNPNAIWQELGTRGRRRKQLKAGSNRQGNPHRTKGNVGVKPLHYMRDGLAAAYPEVKALIEAALVDAGSLIRSNPNVETGRGALGAPGEHITSSHSFTVRQRRRG